MCSSYCLLPFARMSVCICNSGGPHRSPFSIRRYVGEEDRLLESVLLVYLCCFLFGHVGGIRDLRVFMVLGVD